MKNVYFLDTSALIKLYVEEAGSDWLQKQVDDQLLIISRIAYREILHILTYSQREGGLKPTDAQQIIQSFRNHLEKQYYVVELNQELYSIEAELLSQYSLRMDDAIQLASALLIKPHLDKLIFVSADDHLLEVAKAENLETENPNRPSHESMTTNLPLKLDSLPETLQTEGAIRLELVEGIPIFRVSDRVQNRIKTLLMKQKESTLNSEEEKELHDHQESEYYLIALSAILRSLRGNA